MILFPVLFIFILHDLPVHFVCKSSLLFLFGRKPNTDSSFKSFVTSHLYFQLNLNLIRTEHI